MILPSIFFIYIDPFLISFLSLFPRFSVMQYITILSEIYYDIMNKSLESYFAEKASSQELEIEKDIHNTVFDS